MNKQTTARFSQRACARSNCVQHTTFTVEVIEQFAIRVVLATRIATQISAKSIQRRCVCLVTPATCGPRDAWCVGRVEFV